jgi:hypothetical protein
MFVYSPTTYISSLPKPMAFTRSESRRAHRQKCYGAESKQLRQRAFELKQRACFGKPEQQARSEHSLVRCIGNEGEQRRWGLASNDRANKSEGTSCFWGTASSHRHIVPSSSPVRRPVLLRSPSPVHYTERSRLMLKYLHHSLLEFL